MKKTSRAFSLIEVLFAILLLSLMVLFLLPSLSSNVDSSRKIKDTADTTFILQEAIETSRKRPDGNYTESINGKNVDISVEKYMDDVLAGTYRKIRASYGNKSFELIEVYDEEGI